jgi:hypothetical protein
MTFIRAPGSYHITRGKYNPYTGGFKILPYGKTAEGYLGENSKHKI